MHSIYSIEYHLCYHTIETLMPCGGSRNQLIINLNSIAQIKIKVRSKPGLGMVKLRSRSGQDQVKVSSKSKLSQGQATNRSMSRAVQSPVKVRSKSDKDQGLVRLGQGQVMLSQDQITFGQDHVKIRSRSVQNQLNVTSRSG